MSQANAFLYLTDRTPFRDVGDARPLWVKNFLFVLGVIAAALLPATGIAATVDVTTGTQYQTIQGFGVSSFDESNYSTAMADSLWQDQSNAALGTQTNATIGLSILRLSIADSTNTPATDTFAGDPEIADATQALGINPNLVVFGTPWSPPGPYKTNDTYKGNGTGNGYQFSTSTNELITSDYGAYATYLTNWAKACKTAGFTPYAISVQNEPDWDASYDACLYDGQMISTFVENDLGPDLVAAGFGDIVMLPESFGDNLSNNANGATGGEAAPAMAAADDGAQYVKIVANHLYGGGPTEIPASYSTAAGHAVQSWVTEISEYDNNNGYGSANWNYTGDTLHYAQLIHECLVDDDFNAFCYWWIENSAGNNGDDEGLYSATGGITPTYYMMGNWAKFIRPGYTRVACTEDPLGGGVLAVGGSGVEVSAYTGTATENGTTVKRVVIVAINTSTSTDAQTFDYTDQTVTNVYPWTTDAANNVLTAGTAIAVTGGQFTYTLPADSITTFVADCGSSSTPTDTPTLTRTDTPSDTPSVTQTRTSTATPSDTPSRTASPSPSATPSSTETSTAAASATPSVSKTVSDTPTTTPSFSPSMTRTVTVTGSPTGTPSVSATTSATGSPSPPPSGTPSTTPPGSPTGTPSASPISSPTASATMTESFTAGPSLTPTSTATASGSPSPSSTVTESFSPSATPSVSVTGTPSPTSTPSGSTTVTPSPTLTSSVSETATPSRTLTPSAISTATRTNTPTVSVTATASPSALPTLPPTTATLVSTATPLSGPLVIGRIVPVPNPNPRDLYVDMEGPADSIELSVYTPAMVLVGRTSFGPLSVGWNVVPTGALFERLPQGLYYVLAEAWRGDVHSSTVLAKVFVLR